MSAPGVVTAVVVEAALQVAEKRVEVLEAQEVVMQAIADKAEVVAIKPHQEALTVLPHHQLHR
jgi:hypothetical protein